MKKSLEKFTKVMIQPLMYLSVVGIVMVLGALLTNTTLQGILPFLNWYPIKLFGNLVYNCLMVIINNLSAVFIIGIAAAMAKKEKQHAALIGFMSYLMYLTASNTVLTMNGTLAEASAFLGLIGTGQSNILGIQNVDMSVFGGILLGLITGFIYNKTCDKQFKGSMQIYSGARFSFFCMIWVAMAFGVVTTYVWPYAQQLISSLASVIKNTGTFGLFLYGMLERLLIPTGLHHLIYTPFQFSDLGGVLTVNGSSYAGAYSIVMAEMNMPDVARFSDSIYYMAIGFTKMFGYVGIALAFIYTAYKKNKKRVKSMMIPLTISACLASITEPIDFMYCFAAPVLFFVHSCIAGLFIALLKVFDVTAFCGGNLIASTLMNVIVGVDKTHYPMMYLLGFIEIIVYFIVFTFLIKKFNMHTPGREEESIEMAIDGIDTQSSDVVPVKEISISEGIDSLIKGLGGKENIISVENCFTRLRVSIKDPEKVDEGLINKMANSGIVRDNTDIQIVFGLQVNSIKTEVEKALEIN
ncbi:MAG: PTS glucose transporter subunit IIBC [Erysipelotrichia bacterium]|nr:PTS glucose transporter subunit IIBC [Erysipelotrichia bacterium]